jgi:hypothetical protein
MLESLKRFLPDQADTSQKRTSATAHEALKISLNRVYKSLGQTQIPGAGTLWPKILQILERTCVSPADFSVRAATILLYHMIKGNADDDEVLKDLSDQLKRLEDVVLDPFIGIQREEIPQSLISRVNKLLM